MKIRTGGQGTRKQSAKKISIRQAERNEDVVVWDFSVRHSRAMRIQ
jgi:hypothetical protein